MQIRKDGEVVYNSIGNAGTVQFATVRVFKLNEK